jgi:hypothetical protein
MLPEGSADGPGMERQAQSSRAIKRHRLKSKNQRKSINQGRHHAQREAVNERSQLAVTLSDE